MPLSKVAFGLVVATEQHIEQITKECLLGFGKLNR